MSPGEYFEVKYGPSAQLFLAEAEPGFKAELEQQLRDRYNRQDGRDGRIVVGSLERNGQTFGYLWRRHRDLIGILTVTNGEVPPVVLQVFQRAFKEDAR